jgi:hypothetical protein
MNTDQNVKVDERTVAVENASYRWAYGFVILALFVDVMYRSAFRDEAAWDLMALAILPGLFCAFYQARQGTLGDSWVRTAILATCLGAVLGLVAGFMLAFLQ